MKKITAAEAKKIHKNYTDDPMGGSTDYAKAVVINIKEAFSSLIKTEKANEFNDLFEQVSFDTLVCYFGRYSTDAGDTNKNNRNTVIVHLANSDIHGNVTVIKDEIYNFGDLKPPKNIIGDQVS